MIRPLRAAHRGIAAGLAVVLPLGLALALAGRRPPPPPSSLPGAPDAQLPDFDARTPRLRALWSRHQLDTFVYSLSSGGSLVRVASWREPASPDLLLYASAAEPSAERLPERARLLGALGAPPGPRDLVLEPAEATGWLVLYSLGHAEVVGSLPLGGS